MSTQDQTKQEMEDLLKSERELENEQLADDASDAIVAQAEKGIAEIEAKEKADGLI